MNFEKDNILIKNDEPFSYSQLKQQNHKNSNDILNEDPDLPNLANINSASPKEVFIGQAHDGHISDLAANQQNIPRKVATPPNMFFDTGREPKIFMAIRVIILVIESVWTLVVIAELFFLYYNFQQINYSLLSTVVETRDPTITYTVVMRSQIKFFFYKSFLVNSTDGINVTSQYYIEKVNLTAKCANKYEYYDSQILAREASDLVNSYFINGSMVFVIIVMALIIFAKIAAGWMVKSHDIPMMLKLKMKSKFVYELTLYSFLNIIFVALTGILIPLLAMDYDSKCLIGILEYSVSVLFKSYYSLAVCLIVVVVPLFFVLIYTCAENQAAYFCFALFWIMMPAFLLVIFCGHSLDIMVIIKSSDYYLLFCLIGNYIMIAESLIITIGITAITNIKFFKLSLRAAAIDARIYPEPMPIKKENEIKGNLVG